MTTALVRHAWLQKHPSPAAGGGEFHWYPDGCDRELRSHLVERVRGIEPPAVLWELAPERIVWAQPFSAIPPIDGRRYVGLVVTIVEAPASAADLLAALVVPPARPWTSDELPPPVLDSVTPLELEPLARGLISGGAIRIADPSHPALPDQLAQLDRLLPDTTTSAVRRGAFLVGEPVGADRVASLLAAAWRDPTSSHARAFRLLCELSETREQSLDEVAAAGIDPTRTGATHALTDEERAVLAAPPRDLVDVLHSWGRGRFDLCPTAGSLANRLADAVALRVLAQLADGGDAHRTIAEARWYALLPAARRTSLLDALTARATSLRSLVEAAHG